MGELPIASASVCPRGPHLLVIAQAVDGRTFRYRREFGASDQAHAQYFARIVRDRQSIELTHWQEIKIVQPGQEPEEAF